MDPLSLIASILGIVGAISTSYKTIEKIKDLPRAFDEVKGNLPLVQNILRNARNRIENSEVTIPDDELGSILSVLRSCETNAEELSKVFSEFEKRCPRESTEMSWANLRYGYITILKHWKKKRVETLMRELLNGVEKMVWRETFKLATSSDIEKLKEAVKVLSEVEPSAEDSELEGVGIINAEQRASDHAVTQQNNVQGGENKYYSGNHVYGDYTNVTYEYRRTSIKSPHAASPALRHLYLTNPSDDKDRIRLTKGELLEESCDWVQETEEFKDWFNGDKRLLWISGNPGKGKTMLMIGIIEVLEKQVRQRQGHEQAKTALCYYFFEETNSERTGGTSLLRALIWQLVDNHEHLRKYLDESYNKAGRKILDGPNSFTVLSGIWQRMVGDPSISEIYVLVDALDECTQDEAQLKQVSDFVNNISHSHSTKCIVSSRPNDVIASHLGLGPPKDADRDVSVGKHSRVHLCLEDHGTSVANAVCNYINRELASSQILMNNKEKCEKIQNIMREKSQATFLWVHILIQEFKDQDPDSVLSTLEDIRPGLENLYKKMWERVQNRNSDPRFAMMLSTAALAWSPLYIRELALLCKFPSTTSNDEPFLQTLVQRCGSFLSVRQGYVTFVHLSARTYLKKVLFPEGETEMQACIFRSSLHSMESVLKENIYEVTCADGSPPYGVDIDNITVPANNELQRVQYSCILWAYHLIYSQPSSSSQAFVTAYVFLKNYFIYWIEAMGLLRRTNDILVILRLIQSRVESSSEFHAFLIDATRFAVTFGGAIAQAPLQIYVAPHLFAPTEDKTCSALKGEVPGCIEGFTPRYRYWSCCVAVLPNNKAGTFSPDGSFIGFIGNHAIRIFDVGTWHEIRAFDLEGYIEPNPSDFTSPLPLMAFSPDNGHVAFSLGSRNSYYIGILGLQEPYLEELRQPSSHVHTLVFSNTGKFLASGEENGKVHMWAIQDWAEHAVDNIHQDRVSALAFSSDDSMVASGSWDGTIIISHTSTGSVIRTLHLLKDMPHRRLRWIWRFAKPRVLALGFYKDQPILLSLDSGARPVAWNTESWKTDRCDWPSRLNWRNFDFAAVGPLAHYIAFANDTETIGFNVVEGDRVLARLFPRSSQRHFSFSSKDNWLATIDGGIWELAPHLCPEIPYSRVFNITFCLDGLAVIYYESSISISWHGRGRVGRYSFETHEHKEIFMSDVPLQFKALQDGNVLAATTKDANAGNRRSTKHILIDPKTCRYERVSSSKSLGDIPSSISSPPEPKYSLSIDGSWIEQSQRRMLWIPSDYRPATFQIPEGISDLRRPEVCYYRSDNTDYECIAYTTERMGLVAMRFKI